MLFFIDESWHETEDKKFKVGVLSAIQIKSHDFNDCSIQMYSLKKEHLGYEAGNIEIKGKRILRNYLFDKLEAKGVKSSEIALAREILAYIKTLGIQIIASVVLSPEEVDLACAKVDQLERSFFFLFERIDLFMKENHPGLMAKLIFDDRGIQCNQNISTSVSNFFHKSYAGQSFSNIIKVPFFAISNENIGIQMADIVASILAWRFTGDKKRLEFFKIVKSSEFISRKLFEVNGKQIPLRGFKVIK